MREEYRQAQETTTGKLISHQDGVSFRDGLMRVNNIDQRPAQVVKWMSSNELTTYTTVMWADPVTGDRRVSCNCPGWTRMKRGGVRKCAHCDDMLGVATCNRKRVSDAPIRTVDEAVQSIPGLVRGRQLRALLTD